METLDSLLKNSSRNACVSRREFCIAGTILHSQEEKARGKLGEIIKVTFLLLLALLPASSDIN